ncbi:hypothetical protein BC834DRAFT_889998 [Gloeopeniophorella convolvens]|nr:hypothetical protein BC834DRAFT_889998 [Gloeopeniophorella convolvens]
MTSIRTAKNEHMPWRLVFFLYPPSSFAAPLPKSPARDLCSDKTKNPRFPRGLRIASYRCRSVNIVCAASMSKDATTSVLRALLYHACWLRIHRVGGPPLPGNPTAHQGLRFDAAQSGA